MNIKQEINIGFEQQHAVVIGGSMDGLLAAFVLSAHFGQVSVIELARLPEQATPPNGVPQGGLVHSLQGGMVLMDLLTLFLVWCERELR